MPVASVGPTRQLRDSQLVGCLRGPERSAPRACRRPRAPGGRRESALFSVLVRIRTRRSPFWAQTTEEMNNAAADISVPVSGGVRPVELGGAGERQAPAPGRPPPASPRQVRLHSTVGSCTVGRNSCDLVFPAILFL